MKWCIYATLSLACATGVLSAIAYENYPAAVAFALATFGWHRAVRELEAGEDHNSY